MKTKFMRWTLTIFLLTLIFSGNIWAGQEPVSGITLSESQRGRLLDARKIYYDNQIKLGAEMALAENRGDRIMADKEIAFEALKQEVRQINAIALKLELAELGAMEEIKQILTPVQWASYLDALEEIEVEIEEETHLYGEDSEVNVDSWEDADLPLYAPLLN